jgi:hypothetical protein
MVLLVQLKNVSFSVVKSAQPVVQSGHNARARLGARYTASTYY